MSGISSHNLAQMHNSSEKTISGRINSIILKMGDSDLNKATQLETIHIFHLIYTSRISAKARLYFKKHHWYISAFRRNWTVAV
ncbi:hypothetical protein FHW31_003680 [Enterobacter asburiae]|nr:hypothetical protein [Enterobacter asburiae]